MISSFELEQLYNLVGDKTWLNEDFLEENLKSSRDLFKERSLLLRRPEPKHLEVYALLSGLPFPISFSNELVKKQEEISKIIGNSLNYWVKQNNLGIEYFVFQWPGKSISKKQISDISNLLYKIKEKSFLLEIRGIQVHQDGCVIAKGFDDSGVLFRIREYLKENLMGAPKKQSNWAHVPLGRILEPIKEENFKKLEEYFGENKNKKIAKYEIKSIKFIHETQWKMETRELTY